jgi:hypothetical protein
MDEMSTEEILRRVAAGELTPEEAMPLLDAARAGAQPTPPADTGAPAWGTPAGPQPRDLRGEPAHVSEGGAPRLVRLAVSYRSLRVLADPGVDGAFVSGEHTVRRDGDALVVEATGLPSFGGDERPGRFSFSELPRTLPQTLARARAIQSQDLTVRFNPRLPLEIDVAGASVRIVGGEAGARIRLLASALKVDSLRGPLDLDAVSSSVKGTIGPSASSRISAESSSVKVGLVAGTGVRINARNRMGKVVLPGGATKGDMVDPGLRDAVVGDGRGELSVEAVMSSVVIGTDVIGSSATGAA